MDQTTSNIKVDMLQYIWAIFTAKDRSSFFQNCIIQINKKSPKLKLVWITFNHEQKQNRKLSQELK